MTTIFQQFQPTLRQLGFRKTTHYRSTLNGDMRIYQKRIGARTIDVQIYTDGKHRASHMTHHCVDDRRARSETLPTDFTTIAEMVAAIEHEAKRPDPFDAYLDKN